MKWELSNSHLSSGTTNNPRATMIRRIRSSNLRQKLIKTFHLCTKILRKRSLELLKIASEQLSSFLTHQVTSWFGNSFLESLSTTPLVASLFLTKTKKLKMIRKSTSISSILLKLNKPKHPLCIRLLVNWGNIFKMLILVKKKLKPRLFLALKSLKPLNSSNHHVIFFPKVPHLD